MSANCTTSGSLNAFSEWLEEKASLMKKHNCTEEELDEALDAWLDAAKESENSQYDAWGEW